MESRIIILAILSLVLLFQSSNAVPHSDRKTRVDQTAFAFAKVFQNRMVLQKEPSRANVFGFSPNIGATVNAELVTPTKTYTYSVKVQKATDPSVGIWVVELDPQNADTPANISVTSQGNTLTLTNVIFGDVWVCSGQSNMQFSTKQMIDAQDEQTDVNYPNIRLFTIGDRDSAKPLDDVLEIWQPWASPDSNNVGGFSAVCWVFGKDIHKALGYSVGLIHDSWGGTIIEAWSSPDSLAKCGMGGDSSVAKEEERLEQPTGNSVIYNGMIHPLLRLAIKGFIWYQGESDADWGVKMNHYNCTFPAMISDWRQKFNQASNKQTSASFPFGFVQLAPYRNDPTVSQGFTDIRWHQTADQGFAPNSALPNTFMAVAIDLPDFTSPYDPIHPRYKKEIGDRLTLGALAVAYGKQEVYQGPYPSKGEVVAKGVKITYSPSSTLDIRTTSGFELLCSGTWTDTKIQANDTSSVTLGNTCSSGTSLQGVRYAWRESPCALRACAVYEKVNSLPGPPFLLDFAKDASGRVYFDSDTQDANVGSARRGVKGQN